MQDTKAVDLSSALNTSSSSASLSPQQQIPAAAALAVAATRSELNTATNLNSTDYAQQLALALSSTAASTSESTATTTSIIIPPNPITPHQQQTPFPLGNFAHILSAFATQGHLAQQRLPIPQSTPSIPSQFNGSFPPQFLAHLFAQQHQQHQQHLAAAMMVFFICKV